jgi:lipoate-protein ligase B
VVRIDRGGDVTYHGPGQLVGYPILDLKAARVGVHEHVLRIERALIAALASYGIEATRREDCVGVWTAKGKIASLGIRVAKGMSMHGFALNVNADLKPFGYINPCGVPACAVTSMKAEIGRDVPMEEIGTRVAEALGREWRNDDTKTTKTRTD